MLNAYLKRSKYDLLDQTEVITESRLSSQYLGGVGVELGQVWDRSSNSLWLFSKYLFGGSAGNEKLKNEFSKLRH